MQEPQPLSEWTAKLDQHWSQMNSWLENSAPEAAQQIIDICNGGDLDVFIAMITSDRPRAKLMQSFARLALYEAVYRQRVRVELEQE